MPGMVAWALSSVLVGWVHSCTVHIVTFARCSALVKIAVGMTCLVPVLSSRAQAPVPGSAPTPRRVVPGDSSLRGAALRSDTLTYTLTGFRDGDEIPVGTITDVLTQSTSAPPQLHRVLTVQRGTARLIDSTITDLATLGPRLHASLQPQRRLRITFNGTRVRGSIGPVDAPGVAIDTTLGSSVFDSGNWDLIVRAMPLAPDYSAVFRVYDLETGLHDYVVRVIGATTLMGEAAHIVLFQLGGKQEVTVWIGATTRRLLQVETPLGPTTLLRQTLRAPR